MGLKIGFVPTMGALHQGHLSLVRSAHGENDVCCASIYVNPLQFNSPTDLASYPDTFDQDIRAFDSDRCDMVFTGSLDQFFPGATGTEDIPLLDPGPSAAGLEATFRPGHLDGVATIVDRLFDTVGSCRAYFGEKDFQQTLVIRDLARRLGHDGPQVEVVVCPTVREANGLAMSSRNRQLSVSQCTRASALHTALIEARTLWQLGQRSAAVLEQKMRENLDQSGLTAEYAAVRDPENWSAETPQTNLSSARALVAAYVGKVRLIDTLFLGGTQGTSG
jgi:pantoate--beta-alanine ligase